MSADILQMSSIPSPNFSRFFTYYFPCRLSAEFPLHSVLPGALRTCQFKEKQASPNDEKDTKFYLSAMTRGIIYSHGVTIKIVRKYNIFSFLNRVVIVSRQSAEHILFLTGKYTTIYKSYF
jgi:hypothetical protein